MLFLISHQISVLMKLNPLLSQVHGPVALVGKVISVGNLTDTDPVEVRGFLT
jgi:hypothetical protein